MTEVLMGRQIKPYKFKFGCGLILKACLAYPEASGQQSHRRLQGTVPRGAACCGAAPAHRSLGDSSLSQGDKPRPDQWEGPHPPHLISNVLGTIPTQGARLAPRPSPAGQALLCSPDPACPGPACRVMHTLCRTSQTTN